MSEFRGKRYWLVGASEGLGRAVAIALGAAGADVIVSARSEQRLQDLCADIPGDASYVVCDVSDASSVAKAAEKVGQIDGMVYLAGLYWPMRSQEWQTANAEAMCDVNFNGAMRVLGAIMPQMVDRDKGHIVLTGSISGFRGLPGTIGYGASKAGLMYLAESLYADFWRTGIKVQLINPGFIKTRLTDKNDFKMPFIMEPEAAAEVFVAHMATSHFKKNYPRFFSLLFRGSQLLPDWLYYRIFS